jgi:integrase
MPPYLLTLNLSYRRHTMTPFETRLIEDMKLFGYSQRTQDTYLYAVRKLCKHLQKPVEQITNEELRGYLLWHKDKYAPNTTTIALCGVKFCFEKILKKPMPVFELARQPRGLKLPVVLTREEVHAVLGNIRVLRHRACLSLIYSCGLRISEAVSMKVSQIDSKTHGCPRKKWEREHATDMFHCPLLLCTCFAATGKPIATPNGSFPLRVGAVSGSQKLSIAYRSVRFKKYSVNPSKSWAFKKMLTCIPCAIPMPRIC